MPLVLAFLLAATAFAQTDTTRAEFLHLIDRPRVPLAPAESPAAAEGVEEIRFSYAADANQRVPGILLRASPAPSRRRPVVIALHGTGGNKEGQLPLLRRLAGLGFIAIAIDGRYHGERAGGSGRAAYNDAILRAWRTGHEHPFLYDTVWDILRLLDYLETRADVDAARIGAIGFSKGGMELYLAAAIDPRIRVAVPCIGVQSFRWALDHDSWHSRIGTIQAAVNGAARDEGAQVDAAFIQRFYDRVVPGVDGRFDGPAMLPLIAPRPLLTINGDSDPRTPRPGLDLCLDAASRAYAHAGASDRFRTVIEPDTAHKVTPAALDTALEWFQRWLRP